MVVVTGKQLGLTHIHVYVNPRSMHSSVFAVHGLDRQGDCALAGIPESMIFIPVKTSIKLVDL